MCVFNLPIITLSSIYPNAAELRLSCPMSSFLYIPNRAGALSTADALRTVSPTSTSTSPLLLSLSLSLSLHHLFLSSALYSVLFYLSYSLSFLLLYYYYIAILLHSLNLPHSQAHPLRTLTQPTTQLNTTTTTDGVEPVTSSEPSPLSSRSLPLGLPSISTYGQTKTLLIPPGPS